MAAPDLTKKAIKRHVSRLTRIFQLLFFCRSLPLFQPKKAERIVRVDSIFLGVNFSSEHSDNGLEQLLFKGLVRRGVASDLN